VDLAGTLEIVRERLKPSVSETKALLHIECPRGLSVQGEAHAVRTAVENVAANALDAFQARGAGGMIALRAERRDGVVELFRRGRRAGDP